MSDSRNLEHYDAALFGYTVASVVAFGAVVFRYAVSLQRPATRVYWRRGWKLFRDRKNLIANTSSAAKTIVGGMAIQKFIFRRGFLGRRSMVGGLHWTNPQFADTRTNCGTDSPQWLRQEHLDY